MAFFVSRRAVSIAGVVEMADTYSFKPSDIIVSIITGHGLKDPDHAIGVSVAPDVVAANFELFQMRFLNRINL